ncbi:MAG: tetratricopeptide repeat protein [bacterium]
MALHKDFPQSPHAILDPSIRWFPADEALRENSMDKLMPSLVPILSHIAGRLQGIQRETIKGKTMNWQSVIFCYLFILCSVTNISAQGSSMLDKFVTMNDLQKEATGVLPNRYMMVINYNDLATDIVLRIEKLDGWLLEKNGSMNRAIREKTILAADLKQAIIEVQQFLSERGMSEMSEGLNVKDYFEAELFLKEDEKGRKDKEQAGINYCLGNIKFIQLAFKQAEISYKKASKLDPNEPKYLYMLGRINELLGDYQQAIQCFDRVLSIHSKGFPKSHPCIAQDLNNLGIACDNLCQKSCLKKAIKYFEQSLDINYNLAEVDPLNIANNLNNLAISYFSLGEYEKAISCYQQSLSVFRGILNENDSRITCILNNIALSLCSLEKYEDAKKYYQEAMEINIRIWGKDCPSAGQSMNNLGLTCYLLKDYSRAIEYYEQGLTIMGKSFGQDHPCMVQTINNLGLAWYGLEEYRKAIGYFKQALSINRKIFGTNHPDIALSLKYIGLSFCSLGEIKKGEKYFKNSLSIFQRTLGPNHVYTKSTKELLEKL